MQTEANTAVQVSVPGLIRLRRQAALLPLQGSRIKARQSGEYQSSFKGRGMEFDESRPYQPGDDIRNIDWRVTARTGKTHTKLFREERERPVFLWIDLRLAMFFATQGRFKSVLAAELASMIAWSALQQGDRVGGLIFSDADHHEIKPGRGKTAVLRFINQIVRQHNGRDAATPVEWQYPLEHALRRLRRVARPGSLIFLFSDFRQLDAAAEVQLSRLCRHNDVGMLFIHDQLESGLPPAGRYKMTDGREEFLLDTYDNSLVQAYQQQFQLRRQQLQTLAETNRLRLVDCMTRDDPFTVLSAAWGRSAR
ncbi:MAG: DUF58 domain-containing protein [Gammaproteobacteria bacterium]